MEPTDWAPEHSGALRELFALHLSFARIAAAINRKFNTTYSRNAVLGRARRMGLAGNDRSGSPPYAQPRLDRPGEIHLVESTSPRFPWPVPPFRGTKPVELRCVEIDPRHLSPDRTGTRQLPLPLRWGRRGRSHHLLRSSTPAWLELLHTAFSSEPRPRHAIGAHGVHRLAQAGRDGMNSNARFFRAQSKSHRS